MDDRVRQSRRRFLGDTAKSVCGVSLAGLALGLHASKSMALPATALRPPGALSEDEFLGACIRCGQCVRDCPYDTLHLATLGENVTVGTPFFTARDIPCEMCPDIPCLVACPTGALDPELTDIDEARMGVAVLVDQENCLSYLGIRCEVCYRVCPLIDDAITLELEHNQRSGKHAFFLPTVHADHCTGCGKCEAACILEEASIKVLPRELARGKPGTGYRIGWEEKEKYGESLVTPDPEHRYQLPEGLQYDYEGEGLLRGQGQDTVPFSSDPLETLRQGQRPGQRQGQEEQ